MTAVVAPRRTGTFTQYALLAGPLLSMLDSSIVNVAVEPIDGTAHLARGAVEALHQSGWLIVAISTLGAAAALLLPKTRNVALSR